MPGPSIKICGINEAAALGAAIKARADYAGFVFFERSPRHVSPALAADLGARAAGRIGKAGLFVDASDAAIAEGVAAAGLEVLQLHGSETPQRAAELKQRFGLSVWKALAVTSRDDVTRAAIWRGAADLVLFDAKTPAGALPGGMGLSFDWSLLSAWTKALPWGLAGGLTSDNVGDAIRVSGAPLVDTSSGVESAPGVKDVDRIAAFCKAARNSQGQS